MGILSFTDWLSDVRDLLAERDIPPHALTIAEAEAAFDEPLSASDAANNFADYWRQNLAR
jgi:hypothetical protein